MAVNTFLWVISDNCFDVAFVALIETEVRLVTEFNAIVTKYYIQPLKRGIKF